MGHMSELSGGGFGWYAHAPDGVPDDVVGPPVRDVHLRADEYEGPFWSSLGSLGGDFEETHADIGISRSLYDDVMAWNDAALAPDAAADEIFARQQHLLRRLADEVRPEIEVPVARSAPPMIISLLGDDFTEVTLP